MTIPNLFLIGAMKSGTSSLHYHLGAHPEIFMAAEKEPCYFVPPQELRHMWPRMYRRGYWQDPARYLALFEAAGNARIVGESSTLYSKLPQTAAVPAAIQRFAPQARILYLMREPAQRSLSHYWHEVSRGFEQRSADAALLVDSVYLQVSHYAMQLRPYLERFGHEQIMAISLEEFEADPATVYARVLRWLGVDAQFQPAGLAQRHHITPGLVWQTRRGPLARFYRRLPVPDALRRAVGPHWRWRLWRLGVRAVDRATFDQTSIITRLRHWQAPQIDELERLLGREFPEWRTGV